eukprot:NODE_720_length_1685_cov_45.286906_g710_i0.p1 GENE.NODE_720_length_1685_cov_45.286906_g710_i0~~NODE_720_length_1685_cov_45.286906_g710_i0.p1  ORF type:complete len:347 (+),score=44.70 NODE_720_length_1685_cov_45.286906_g710_i0:423-1463(+)
MSAVELPSPVEIPDSGCSHVAFHPTADPPRLLVATEVSPFDDDPNLCRLVALPSGRDVWSVPAAESCFVASFARSGNALATCTSSGLAVFTSTSEVERWRSAALWQMQDETPVFACLTYDGRMVASNRTNRVAVFDVTADVVATLDNSTVNHGEWQIDGKTLVLATDTGARIWDTRGDSAIALGSGCQERISLAQTGDRVAVCSALTTVAEFDFRRTDTPVSTFDAKLGGLSSAEYSPDGSMLVVGGGNGCAVWGRDGDAWARVGTAVRPKLNSDTFVWWTTWSEDGSMICAADTRTSLVWDTSPLQTHGCSADHAEPSTGACSVVATEEVVNDVGEPVRLPPGFD